MNRATDTPGVRAPLLVRLQKERSAADIVVLRALPGLGDLLCAVPALRALRAAAPHARITLLGLELVRALAVRYRRLIDRFEAVPGFPGLPEQEVDEEALATFLTAMRARRPDLALQLHGDGRVSNRLVLQLGAAHAAGSYPPGEAPPGEYFLPSEEGPEIRRMLRPVLALGAPDMGDHLEFPLLPSDEALGRGLLRAWGLPRRGYVCVQPGASRSDRRWGVSGFAAVADAHAAEGQHIALTGTAAEVGLTAAVRRRMQAPAADLGGRTSVGGLAALFAGAGLVVCNDTGAAHLAAALGTPSVVIFAPGADVVRWAPLDGERHVALAGHSAPDGSRPLPAFEARQHAVSVPDVVEAARRLLRHRYREADLRG